MKPVAGKQRVWVVGIVVAGLLFANTAAAGAATSGAGDVRAVVTFVGDSNIMMGATELALTFTNRDQPYAIVDLAVAGSTIRSPGCSPGVSCSGNDFWKTRLDQARATIATDVYVVNLGINDSLPGTPTGPGYSNYAAKIDWMMPLYDRKPVFWTNLPCAIEPPARAVGCAAVNDALDRATSRWPNLHVIDWAGVANDHPEYMFSGGLYNVHYSTSGDLAWALTVAAQLDASTPTVRVRTPIRVNPVSGRLQKTAAAVADNARVITFVGDSNITLGATMQAVAFTMRDHPYMTVNLARPGTTIRYPSCAPGTPCTANDFWKTRLEQANAAIESNAYVVNLGINDTPNPGATTGPGYADYGAKIDWMMPLFNGKPVFWTNLPCAIEPPVRAVGCAAVNAALDAASDRWPNLQIVDWAAAANPHPDYIRVGLGGVHFTPLAYVMWAITTANLIDPLFGQPRPPFFDRFTAATAVHH